jgi:uncharacterized damage-inducible protein DinB
VEHGISFEALLDYAEAEERRWEDWFRRNPGALDLQVEISDSSTVREFVRHIFGVGRRTAERLLNEPMTSDEKLDITSIESLFSIGADACAKLRRFLAQSNEASLSAPRQFQSATLGSFRATPRKLLTHAVVHGIRHWAQLATLLRQQGYKTDWRHDVLFTDAIQ